MHQRALKCLQINLNSFALSICLYWSIEEAGISGGFEINGQMNGENLIESSQ